MFISPKDMQSTNRELHSSRSKLHRKMPLLGTLLTGRTRAETCIKYYLRRKRVSSAKILL